MNPSFFGIKSGDGRRRLSWKTLHEPLDPVSGLSEFLHRLHQGEPDVALSTLSVLDAWGTSHLLLLEKVLRELHRLYPQLRYVGEEVEGAVRIGALDALDLV